MKIETVAISVLQKDPENARKHSKKNIDAIAGSLKKFGQRRPLVVWQQFVIAGNGTLDAAQQIGWTEIEITRVPEDWTHEEARAYAIADNRTSELAEWDDYLLSNQLVELDAVGWNIADFGFDPLTPPTNDSQIDDKFSTGDENVRCKFGDIWQIGSHMVVCGDANDSGLLDSVIGNTKVEIILTDPPYGINLETDFGSYHVGANTYQPIAGDNKPFDASFFISNYQHVKEQFWWGGDYYAKTLPDDGSWLVWDKRYNEQDMRVDELFGSHFELCWSKQKHKRKILRHLWVGHHGFQGEDTKKRAHPTQKPIRLFMDILNEWTNGCGMVLDFFAGAGSVQVAAEKLGRFSLGIEIEPTYCDVILTRLEGITGLESHLLNE
jgi:site-specific DNA-methyltransferase (adenine-specific)